ncbi:hypothetical protein [Pragia fontium]|uniref:Pilus biogenesis CpaD protein (Pilus_cpaD) n=2 Tax=Pragia fontium TaxID=82985 RepID=A0AAJ5BG25_9GAMM|nr:hypothetical protein [Pragia fontium]GKX63306.1 hypothetical protein SOASR032_18750 [Pragia fontium]SFC13710.1 Pilus biogenesis CpaD protein (pilus_cpaD) [Pragia fontium DSM 5563 = ATCC 49100]SUB81321.1 pilus (Caulobacter type) biogenesis lipoprotein CpaD [Pragia fontium]VEJ53496.1 pilus (Caulobacter type) biogenesis lipoprotein CpaD [Pragia fontium]
MKLLATLALSLFTVVSVAQVQAKDQTYNSRFYASPEVETESFALNGKSEVDKEILLGKLLHRISSDSNSTVSINWSKSDFKPVAEQIRKSLINNGIAPYTIKIHQSLGGFDTQVQANLTVRIESVRLRAQHCNYNRQNYYYRKNDDLGCALNNTLRRSLVNPMDFMF